MSLEEKFPVHDILSLTREYYTVQAIYGERGGIVHEASVYTVLVPITGRRTQKIVNC